MITSAIQAELIEVLGRLPAGQQRQVLEFARSLQSATVLPPGTPARALLKFVGRISKEDARLMEEAIADCERIDARDW